MDKLVGIRSRVNDIIWDKLENEFMNYQPVTDRGLSLSNFEANFIPKKLEISNKNTK